MEAAYRSSPATKSENSHAPILSLEVQQQHMPNSMTKFQLAKAILDLYRMGLIAEEVDKDGVPRWTPVEGRTL
jgi:hypothetical protein